MYGFSKETVHLYTQLRNSGVVEILPVKLLEYDDRNLIHDEEDSY